MGISKYSTDYSLIYQESRIEKTNHYFTMFLSGFISPSIRIAFGIKIHPEEF